MNSTTSGAPEKGGTLQDALRFARLGWPVLPVHGIAGGRCTCRRGESCSAPGKHPRTKNGGKGASSDPQTIHKWWSRWPDANIGVATGEPSGIIVLDIDGLAGRESLKRLTAELGKLPAAPTAKTGRGFHLFFRWPGRPVRNRIGLADGVDLKGDGGFVVVPPSQHANGVEYTWKTPPEKVPPPELPATWSQWAVTQNSTERRRTPQNDTEQLRTSHEIQFGSQASLSTELPRSVEEAILSTLPRKAGERHRRVFQLVRRLKALPETREADLELVRPVAEGWFSKAVDTVRTKDFETT